MKQITLRLPDEIYETIGKKAQNMGISLNSYILINLEPLFRHDFPQIPSQTEG
jgi:predicted HicB family RNase H-like nuclease